jgi:hypothetical protein
VVPLTFLYPTIRDWQSLPVPLSCYPRKIFLYHDIEAKQNRTVSANLYIIKKLNTLFCVISFHYSVSWKLIALLYEFMKPRSMICGRLHNCTFYTWQYWFKIFKFRAFHTFPCSLPDELFQVVWSSWYTFAFFIIVVIVQWILCNKAFQE